MTSATLFTYSTFAYLLTSMIYIDATISKFRQVGIAGTIVTTITVLGQTAALILRWIESYQAERGATNW